MAYAFTRNILFVLLVALATSCSFKRESWSELPKSTSIDSLQQTEFLPTLENPTSPDKNEIYAAAFLYAWDKVAGGLKSPVMTDSSNSQDFRLLAKSHSYQNSLESSEYSVTAEVSGGEIIAKAFFNKTLPFQTKLQKLDSPIVFGTTKVEAFGMYRYSEDIVTSCRILYYENYNNFILRLQPKDTGHEVILIMNTDNYRTLADALKIADARIDFGKLEKGNMKILWKYDMLPDDIFAIPVIAFNIETHYQKFEGQKFVTDKDKALHHINEAIQRTGFILNENGAVIESEVTTTTDSVETEPSYVTPKKMVFDKSFLVVIKHTGRQNPYFVMKVGNAELLTKKPDNK